MASAQRVTVSASPSSPRVNTTLKLCRTIAKLERRVRQLEKANR
jgi:hypothetical protein